MRSLLLPLSLLVACGEPSEAPTVDVRGHLALEDDGLWRGSEERTMVDDQGECLVSYDLEAEEVGGSASCPRCEPILHLLHVKEVPLEEGCGQVLTEAEGVPVWLGFVGDEGEGDVVAGHKPEGPWTLWSSGILADGNLSWHHVAEPDPDPGFDEDDLRPPQKEDPHL